MKDHTGKPLERLVRAIEEEMLPEGFEVTSNDRVIEDGEQIAEFDIVITGRLGSTDFKWLIECRDRPSQGAASGAWIEQLVSRRSRFNFDKVIAVSTSGFAEGAAKYASEQGIHLRTVTEITDIANDVKVSRLRYKTTSVVPQSPFAMSYDAAPATHKKIREHKTLRLRTPGDPNFCDFEHFCLWHMHHEEAVKAVKINYTYLVTIEVNEAEIEINGSEIVTVQNLKFPIEVRIRFLEAKTVSLKVYAEGERLIGQEAQFESKTEYGNFLATALLIKESDDKPEQIKSVTIDEIPVNYTLDLLGLE